MERENPTREELERLRAGFGKLADLCWKSATCPCKIADAWTVEHLADFEWGCPGWCGIASGAEAGLREEAGEPFADDEIPF